MSDSLPASSGDSPGISEESIRNLMKEINEICEGTDRNLYRSRLESVQIGTCTDWNLCRIKSASPGDYIPGEALCIYRESSNYAAIAQKKRLAQSLVILARVHCPGGWILLISAFPENDRKYRVLQQGSLHQRCAEKCSPAGLKSDSPEEPFFSGPESASSEESVCSKPVSASFERVLSEIAGTG